MIQLPWVSRARLDGQRAITDHVREILGECNRERHAAEVRAAAAEARAQVAEARAVTLLAEARLALADSSILLRASARAIFGDQSSEVPENPPSVREADRQAALRQRAAREDSEART